MSNNTHYVLIDTNSGYIWGDAFAKSAIQACAVVDADIDPGTEYDYEEANQNDTNATYAVYTLTSAQEDFLWTDDGDQNYDGQDQDLIELVESQAKLDCYVARSESE